MPIAFATRVPSIDQTANWIIAIIANCETLAAFTSSPKSQTPASPRCPARPDSTAPADGVEHLRAGARSGRERSGRRRTRARRSPSAARSPPSTASSANTAQRMSVSQVAIVAPRSAMRSRCGDLATGRGAHAGSSPARGELRRPPESLRLSSGHAPAPAAGVRSSASNGARLVVQS